jgi:hypothetical protein
VGFVMAPIGVGIGGLTAGGIDAPGAETDGAYKDCPICLMRVNAQTIQRSRGI